jgi:hypothetical protein
MQADDLMLLDLDAALSTLERIEHVPEIFWRAQVLEKANRIPVSNVEKLRKIKARFQFGK